MVTSQTGQQDTSQVDIRAFCGIKDCENRAMSLFAWPKRLPVPLCAECRETIMGVVERMKAGEMQTYTQDQWLRWLRQHGKSHLFGG